MGTTLDAVVLETKQKLGTTFILYAYALLSQGNNGRQSIKKDDRKSEESLKSEMLGLARTSKYVNHTSVLSINKSEEDR